MYNIYNLSIFFSSSSSYCVVPFMIFILFLLSLWVSTNFKCSQKFSLKGVDLFPRAQKRARLVGGWKVKTQMCICIWTKVSDIFKSKSNEVWPMVKVFSLRKMVLQRINLLNSLDKTNYTKLLDIAFYSNETWHK